ncbi:MAG: hypothetical protein ACYDD1_11600 [Caulobacteraceae bacterium]
MLWSLLVRLEVALIVSGCVMSIIKGAPADRAGASLILLFYMADELTFLVSQQRFPTTLIFFGDFILAVGLLVVAIRYSSLWLGCAMLLQSIDLCSQGLALGGDGLSTEAQIWLNNAISMAMVASVVMGASISWRRRIVDRHLTRDRRPVQFSI